MRRLIVALIIVCGVAALVAYGEVGQRLGFVVRDLTRLASPSALVDENTALKKENATLRAQLVAGAQTQSEQRIALTAAKVFSLYPFNIKSTLYITAGAAQNVEIGDGVLFSPRVFMGKVVRVSRTTSEVITVFDPSFSLPVRVGAEEVDGLLEGGLSPRVTLIDKNKPVKTNDAVYTTHPSLAYGLLVGTVSLVHDDASGAFIEAEVAVPYVLADVRDVLVTPSPANAAF